MNKVSKQIFYYAKGLFIFYYCRISIKEGVDIETEKPHQERFIDKTFSRKCKFVVNFLWLLKTLKPCSDERQNGLKSLKLKRCKFLQPSFIQCEHDCFCLKRLKHFRFKCLRRFLKINFIWFLKTVLRTLKTSFKN